MATSTIKGNKIERKWYLIDAKDKILGRIATRIATILIGKNKPIWSPNIDTGDFVIVINAEKIKVTGKKLFDKKYYKHSGYIGSLKEVPLYSLLNKSPETVIKLAVKGMLPKNKLGRKMIKKLKVYKGEKHPHISQNLILLEVN